MEKEAVPVSLRDIEVSILLDTLNLYLQNKKKSLYVRDAKSVFGRTIEQVTGRNSTYEERQYLHKLWTNSKKENEPPETVQSKIRKSEKHLRKKTRRRLTLDGVQLEVEADCSVGFDIVNVGKNQEKNPGLPKPTSQVSLDLATTSKRKTKSPHKSAGFLKRLKHGVQKRVKSLSCLGTDHENVTSVEMYTLRTRQRKQPQETEFEEAKEISSSSSGSSDKQMDDEVSSGDEENEEGLNEISPEMEKIIEEYNKRLMAFPEFECPICKKIVYNNRNATGTFTFGARILESLRKLGFEIFNENETIKMCRRCYETFRRNKIPSQSHFNAMALEETPTELAILNDVEIRLISQIKAYMKIYHLSKGQGQLALKGTCIHFPLSVDQVVETLPLSRSAADVVIVNETNEKTGSNTNFKVRARLLYDALLRLKQINPLYRNITIRQLPEEDLSIQEVNLPENANLEPEKPTKPATGFKMISENNVWILRSANCNPYIIGESTSFGISIYSLAYSNIQSVNTWSSAELDNVIAEGGSFNQTISDIDASGITVSCFAVKSVKINTVNPPTVGKFNKVKGKDNIRLKDCIQEFVDSDELYGLLNHKNSYFAIIKAEGHLFFVDPHLRGPKGKIAEKGYPCALKLKSSGAPAFLSEHVHRICQPPYAYKVGLSEEEQIKFQFKFYELKLMEICSQTKNVGNHTEMQPEELGYIKLTDTSDILRASFHQGSTEHFPMPGNQCAAIAATAVASAAISPPDTWTTSFLNNVLLAGDRFYGSIMPDRNEFLDPQDAHGVITCFGGSKVNCKIAENQHEHLYGFFDSVGDINAPTLLSCLQRFLISEYNFSIFTANNLCLGLIYFNDKLYIVDSHSRGSTGLFEENGAACVVRFSTEEGILYASEFLHNVCAPSVPFSESFSWRQKGRYGFSITPLICEVEYIPPAENVDAPQDTVTVEPDPVGEQMQAEQADMTTALDPPAHKFSVQLDCVIRMDQPDLPELSPALQALRNDENIFPEVTLRRAQGRPLYDGIEQRLEELSFVRAFPYGVGGHNEPRKIKITPLDYFQQRILSSNLYFHTTEYLFYALNKIEAYTIQQKIAVCGNLVTGNAEQGLLENFVPGIENVHLYMGAIRGSGSYWKKYTAEVLSMIAQLGVPTFFLTISYDDLNSVDALTALWKGKFGIHTDVPNVSSLPFQERKELLNEQPVAAARHFNHRMNTILSLLLNQGEAIFGRKIIDFTYRVEFQGRGSPHIHALLWAENAPDWNTEEGIQFLEHNISCSLNVPFRDLVVRYQHHSHRATCFKKHNHCRFAFPRRPSDQTRILDDEEIKKSHGRFVELKRTPDEAMINNYNPRLLQILRCNMDIQAVTGTHAIAYYIGKYMSKGEPTYLRDEIRDIINKFKNDKTTSHHRQVQQIITSIIKHREISSQEAAFRVLRLKLKNSSRVSEWIPVFRPEKRVRMVRRDTLNAEPKVGLNIIDRYFARPDSLEHLSLIEFAAWYKPMRNVSRDDPDEDLIDGDVEYEEHEETLATIQLQNNKGKMRRRQRHAVIRYPLFKPLEQTEDYLYSMILLYKPLRNENFLEEYASVRDAFDALKSDFRTNEHDPIINPDAVYKIVSVLQQLDEIEPEVDNTTQDDDVLPANMFEDEDPEPLRAEDVFVAPQNEHVTLQERVQTLTPEQKQIYEKVRRQIVLREETPLRLMVHGCGGTGKSYLIDVLTELITKSCPAGHRALIKCAPTGVASKNIRGITIHKAFSLGVEKQSVAQYMKLGDRLLHERRLLYKDVLFIFIDEVSMISYETFRQIHLRLTEIFGKNLPFGGINIILFGDLLQLSPCRGHWIFEQPEWLSAEQHLWKLFTYTNLKTVMRQKQQDQFYHFLQRLRIGDVIRDDVEYLKQFVLHSESPNFNEMLKLSQDSLHLYPKVFQVEEYNNSRIKKMEAEGVRIYTIQSYDTYGSGTKFGTKVPSNKIYKDIRKCAGIATEVQLALGAKVMLRWNIEPVSGLCNGSLGLIRKFNWTALRRDQLKTGDLPESVLVEFEGEVAERHLCRIPGFERCTAIQSRTFEFNAIGGDLVHRKQIPLVLSFGCTIHKSQGLSLDSGTVYMGKHIFTHAQLYVALSRLRSVKGLIIIELDETKLLTCKKKGRIQTPCDNKSYYEVTRLDLIEFLEVPEESIENFSSLISWCIEFIFCRVCNQTECNCTCYKKVGPSKK